MWTRIRHASLYFLTGFVFSFLIYLFIRWEPDLVLQGMAIAAGAGVLFALLIVWLEHRFPDDPVGG